MEQKLESRSEVVVSIMSHEQDHQNAHIGFSSVQTDRSSSNDTPNMPSKISVETATEKLSVPPHSITLGMASPTSQTISSKPKKVYATTSKIEEVPQDPQRKENGEDEEDEEIDDGLVYGSENFKAKQKKADKWKVMYMIEFTLCSCIVAVFITSLAVRKIRHITFWGLQIWRWCVLLFVIFGGRLWTQGLTNVLVFLIERNCVLKKKVLYFVYSLKRSIQVLLWLVLILLTWVVLISYKLKVYKVTLVEREVTTAGLKHVTRFLLCSVFGAGLWVVKTFLVKILACSFHVKRYFDRIQDSVFHHFILLTLSKPPTRKEKRLTPGLKLVLILQKLMKGKIVEKQSIDIEKLGNMMKETVSAWTISGLINFIQGSDLATISGSLDECEGITNVEDAKRAGNKIFTNVANVNGRNSQYIEEANLLEFLKREDVEKVFNMFKCTAESRKIKRITLRNWVVKVYQERELLKQSMCDAKTAIQDLNRILSGIALVTIIVMWLVLMGLTTTPMLVFVASQLLAATFIFGNSCKTGFECILYIFVMHPYDVGDDCIIDGVQMTVEEMTILTTIFKSGKETIVYPNSVLTNKPISNIYRTPVISESVEFVIDVSTSADTIAKLKSKIEAYIDKKEQQWNPFHQFKEIKYENKLKVVLYVNPVTKFQDYGENSNRRPELLSEIKKIFEELKIKYYYLPQEVHLSNVGSDGH